VAISQNPFGHSSGLKNQV